jgi:NADPH:quinone reductase-like Zn-dependent oxidoreductase
MVKRFLLVSAIALSSASTARAQDRMKAIVYHRYGSPEVLRLEAIEKPAPKDDEILVKVRAASVNPLDWHYMEGAPYVVRLLGFGLTAPKNPRLGVDFAGTVEAAGKNVTEFKPGDDVFGTRTGAFAEYVTVRAAADVVKKPAAVTFEQAASVPVAAVTALQALRDAGKLRAGQKVLINGASGGVGTFAVQLAKSMGAEVTGVCSTRNVELVRSLGADHVVDYTKEDFTRRGERYDLIVDNVANHSLLAIRRALAPRGTYILNSGGSVNENRWTGTLALPLRALVLSRLVSQDMRMMLADTNKADLTLLGDLVAAGKLKPVIDRRYKLGETREAIRYLETGHARGKVVLTIEPDDAPIAAAPAGASGGGAIALALVGVPILVSIVPIALAIVLNRRFRRRHPDRKPYRWGYYFSIVSAVAGLVLGTILESVLVCGLIYAVLACFFALRHRWAWLALTVLSFNPIVWIINGIYLRKRWAEARV